MGTTLKWKKTHLNQVVSLVNILFPPDVASQLVAPGANRALT